jgi:hypothetical protein
MKEADVVTPVLPENLKYNPKIRTLTVTWTDHSRTRYFDLDPRLAFLSNGNYHAHPDFLSYIEKTPDLKSEVIDGDE